ncbi:MAG: hypothetical protein N3A38_04195 [Planctomycetota bacterium]|nr:hypothetical protein [Planctomycetota bacterium]
MRLVRKDWEIPEETSFPWPLTLQRPWLDVLWIACERIARPPITDEQSEAGERNNTP